MDGCIIKLAGVGLVGLGILAWKTFFFAGTGFAFIICAVIVLLGLGLLAAD